MILWWHILKGGKKSVAATVNICDSNSWKKKNVRALKQGNIFECSCFT